MKRKSQSKRLRWVRWVGPVVLAWLAAVPGSIAQVPVLPPGFPTDAAPGVATEPPPAASTLLKFSSAPVDLLLEAYAEQTGRTLLLAPSLPSATITLRSQVPLSQEEYLEAIETVLGMHGIALLKEGERFCRVVPNKQAREEPMPILPFDPEAEVVDRSELISQMIPLKHIEAADALNAIKPLQHAYAQTHAFEAINSIMVTDTAANVNRVVQIVSMIDQPVEAREEPIVVQIVYAKASDIKQKLEQIIAETQQDEKKSTVQRQRDSGAPGVEAAPATPPGIIRARRPAQTQESVQEIIAAAERGVIRGTVKIVEDDRTNILILITRPENMSFFEKIIQVLDVETAPDVMVRVIRLEYAEADKISTMLNDLIGATSEEDATRAAPAAGEEGESKEAAAALREFVARQEAAGQAAKPGKSKVGELSKDNIKILSDERTNSLIIMASKSDVAALEDIIRDMDMMLSQVLIEAVILQVNLDDRLQTGVDWIQRALLTSDSGPAGALRPRVGFAGQGGGGDVAPVDPLNLTTPGAFGSPAAGLSYYLTFFDLNIDAVVQMAASDSRTRILSSPVILTTDNKAATIEVTQDRYFFKGQKPVSAGSNVEYVDDVERQKVGIKLVVTPRINEKHFVVMEIEQTIEDVAGTQKIGNNDWPIVSSRKLDADVAVRSGDTIVLGGLVQSTETTSKNGIPFLADIPLLGFPFRSKNRSKERQEVIVLITPYVLDTPEEIMADANRRKDSMGMEGMWHRGWSDSKLAEEPPKPTKANTPRSAGKRPKGKSAADAFMAHRDSLLGGVTMDDEQAAPAPVVPAEPAPAEPAETAVAVAPVPDGDPMDALDRESRRYVEQQDRRWRRELRRIDRRVDRDYSQD